MKKNIAAVFENNLNFGGISHSISFFSSVEEAMKASHNVDDGGPHLATSIFQYAFPAKVATKSLEWVTALRKELPKNIDIIKTEYRPIMRKNYTGSTYPLVDGIEVEVRLGNFFRRNHSPFMNTKIRIGFFRDTEFGMDVIKQDYFYDVVDSKPETTKTKEV